MRTLYGDKRQVDLYLLKAQFFTNSRSNAFHKLYLSQTNKITGPLSYHHRRVYICVILHSN